MLSNTGHKGPQDMLTAIFCTIFPWHEISKASHVYQTWQHVVSDIKITFENRYVPRDVKYGSEMWFYNNLQTCDQTTILVVSHQLLAIKSWAQSRGTPCGPCGMHDTGAHYTWNTSIFPFQLPHHQCSNILLSSAAGTTSPLQAATAKNMWWPTAKIIQVRNVQRHILIFAAWFSHSVLF